MDPTVSLWLEGKRWNKITHMFIKNPHPSLSAVLNMSLEQDIPEIYVPLLENCKHVWQREVVHPLFVSDVVDLDAKKDQSTQAIDAFITGLCKLDRGGLQTLCMQYLILMCWRNQRLVHHVYTHPLVLEHQLPRVTSHWINLITPRDHSDTPALDWVLEISEKVQNTVSPEEILLGLEMMSTHEFYSHLSLTSSVEHAPQMAEQFVKHWMSVCRKKDASWWERYIETWDGFAGKENLQMAFPQWSAFAEQILLTQHVHASDSSSVSSPRRKI